MPTNNDLKTAGGVVNRSQSVVPFFRRYPVVAIAGGAQVNPAVDLKPIRVPLPPMVAGPALQRAPGEDDYDIIVKANRVKYLTIAAFADFRAPLQSPALGSNASMAISAVASPAAIPLFWLPYDLNHHRRLTLVAPAGLPNPPGNPRFFLTDMIDGCSIYVEGTPAAPTVHHINANKVLPINVAAFPNAADQSAGAIRDRRRAWRAKWGNMDNRFQNNPKPARVVNNDPALIAGRKLEQKDYMFRTDVDRLNYGNGLAALQANNSIPANVGGQSVDELEALFTQGTAFGAMDRNNEWHFYVQRRVLVQLFHHTVVPLVAQAPGRLQRMGLRPMPVVPQGPPVMNRILLGNMWLIRSVNEFWPGATVGSAAP